jgi:RimJ/RimL family protein N-acetyltransferase
MMSPANHSEIETLKSGTTVCIRAIRPDDKRRLAAAFDNLEPESIYSRFFYQKQTLTDAELTHATEVDFESIVALVVTVGDGEGETIIGAGRYMVIDMSEKPPRAEVAFAVEEDFHRQGIAGMILRHLAAIAREKGVVCFEAEVLPKNIGMLAVFSRCGFPVQTEPGRDTVHVTISLTDNS